MFRTNTKKLTKVQERFVRRFIDIAYENMAIEKEAPFTRQQAYQRYRNDALDLIRDGTYKTILGKVPGTFFRYLFLQEMFLLLINKPKYSFRPW